MSSEKQAPWFEDILENIARIERFTTALDIAKLGENEQAFFAVLRRVVDYQANVGSRLGTVAEVMALGPPWRAIRDLGNVLRHAYDGVDPAVIARIIRNDLATLKQAVEQAHAEMSAGKQP